MARALIFDKSEIPNNDEASKEKYDYYSKKYHATRE